jgi:TolB protein
MRKLLCTTLCLGAATFLLVFESRSQVQAQTQVVKTRLANLRQLTHGGENAEAYWAPDGKRLIFQSTRDGHDCDQQYIMNADGSNPHLVSTGKGVTTCGYFLADGKHILYASTHEGSASCPAKPDRSKGYLWAVYPDFDIYLAEDTGKAGKILKKLTNTPGYDAEATINWKTHRIIYTSMASGDLDVWSMNEDGSDKKQLTKAEGYDGGAVFSRDGSQMVWRAYRPDTPEKLDLYRSLLKENLTAPMKMELFVARSDGSAAKRITDYGCASFAPTFTPDGKKILFASNKHNCDSSDFELYLINTDGTGLEQVTSYGGFTSFPEFSPDGTRMAFVSSYKGQSKYEFNVFTADWK